MGKEPPSGSLTEEATIDRVLAQEVVNGRGEWTIEVTVVTKMGARGRASAPSGASRGKYEVADFPPGGVKEALKKVSSLVEPALRGLSVRDQETVDRALREIDGTPNFGLIGGNTAYAVSVATLRAASAVQGVPLYRTLPLTSTFRLPFPLGNVIGGGRHSMGKAPDVQEFLVLPIGARSFLEAISVNILVHRMAGEDLLKRVPKFAGGRSDEGAWSAPITSEEALEVLANAANAVMERVGTRVGIGLDVAASSLWDPKRKLYRYANDGEVRNGEDQLDFILDLIRNYELVYVEDPFHEDDYESFSELTKRSRNCLICGDDLFVTRRQRLEVGVEARAGNAVIIKPNQVGTITEAMETARFALENDFVAVLSHRSGETEDPAISHLAVSLGCPIIKSGIIGGERVAKMNELIRIEREIGEEAQMARVRYVS